MANNPGLWQYFLQRADNIGIPIDQAQRKYLIEVNQFEESLSNFLAFGGGGTAHPNPITVAEVLAQQAGWSQAVVNIGSAYTSTSGSYLTKQAAASAVASTVIASAYNYDLGPCFFRPTLTNTPYTFRNTSAGALSYFVGPDNNPSGPASGSNPNYPDDTGFALNGWNNVVFNNDPMNTGNPYAGINCIGNIALTMGYVTFSGSASYPSGSQPIQVDKTFGYYKYPSGEIKIILHFSALTNLTDQAPNYNNVDPV
jgi:hypothetical protein